MSKRNLRSVLLIAGMIIGLAGAGHAEDFCTSQKELANTYLTPIKSVGMMVVALKLGEPPCFIPRGTLDDNSSKAPDANTIFELASVTKVFTTAILAIHQGQGLNVNVPVKPFLPPGYGLNTGEEIVTFQQLATFTGGFSWSQPPGYKSGKSYSQKDFETQVNLLTPTNSIPGETLPTYNHYSNGSVGFLGQILMHMDSNKGPCLILTGCASYPVDSTGFSNWIAAYLTGPLGMTNTSVEPGGERTTGYHFVKSSGTFEPKPPFPWEPWGAAGALRSNANDMLKFLQANICAHHQSDASCTGYPKYLLNALATAQFPNMYTPWGTLTDPWIYLGGKTSGAVQAWAWDYVPPPVSSSTGTAIIKKNGGHPGFSSFIGLDPDKKYGLVILMNTHQKALAEAGTDIIQHTAK